MNEDDVKKPNNEEVGADPASLLSACQKQRDEYLNGWKRAQADLANYKKDEMKRLEEISEYSVVGFVKDVLPVLDSFGFALVTVEKESPAYKGIVMIQSQLLDILKRRGVEKIAVSKGDEFNPEFHEAMMEVDAPPGEENLSGKILEELVAGYVVKGRVIRAVKVKIVK